jgi:hypothetical protein
MTSSRRRFVSFVFRLGEALQREVDMKTRNNTLLVLALALAATACNKPPEPKTANASAASDSVALPQSKMPPSDAAIAPNSSSGGTGDSGAAGTGNAGGSSQQRPTELGKSEEQSKLPLSGQVNNHSVPDTTEQKTEQTK